MTVSCTINVGNNWREDDESGIWLVYELYMNGFLSIRRSLITPRVKLWLQSPDEG